MKRNGSTRAASPTNTTFSGISNYRTESYRPLRTPSSNQYTDNLLVARTHFQELSQYLASYLAQQSANSRSTARQKLTRLTTQQFQELSTDVYDELLRRKNNSSDNLVPFLPVRDDFHPKRNQARQKLATLPINRFKDLSSDVYYELARRYPQFKEEEVMAPDPMSAISPGSSYDDQPSPDFPRPARTSEDRGNDSGYGGSTPGNDTYSRRKPSQDMYGSGDPRRPSQDTTLGRRSSERERGSTTGGDVQSATAGMGRIVPNKSTITEEEIVVPYPRGMRDSGSTARNRNAGAGSDSERDGEEEMSPRSPPAVALGGLNGLSARLQQDDGGGRSEEDYYERGSYGRQSVQSDRSTGATGIGARMNSGGGRTSVAGQDERMRRDYEYKIATMEAEMKDLERNLKGAQDREREWVEGEARTRAVEQELLELRRDVEEKSTSMLSLQQELDALREERASEKDMAERLQRQDREEIRGLRERCEVLESSGGSGNVDSALLDQLQTDMEGLMTELSDLSRRNDELLSAKDKDMRTIRNLEKQLEEYQRRYEQAKTELRSERATSQLYLNPPKIDDQLPVSPDGGLVDIHVTGFLSSINSLLEGGRMATPAAVVRPMIRVVNSVTAIIDDVKAFEVRPARNRAETDMDALRSLRERLEATLSNLVTAARTHAMGAGMSPVSLLDAAASHVAATVTEIGKTILMRKATRAEQDAFMPTAPPTTAMNGFVPSLTSVEELPSHQRSGSSTSSRADDDARYNIPSVAAPRATPRRPPSNVSSSAASSPPPLGKTKTNGSKSSSSATAEGPEAEDAWTELKPYLEAQTESIVYAIQSVLSGVRSATSAENLKNYLATIISIIASIVSVCKDNLPPGSRAQGAEILRELSTHAEKLQEVRGQADITKEQRQVMAKSSFAVANAMKSLMKL